MPYTCRPSRSLPLGSGSPQRLAAVGVWPSQPYRYGHHLFVQIFGVRPEQLRRDINLVSGP